MLPFIIILIGIILIVVNLKLINKEEKLEESFGRILEREELNDNKDYGLEIISIRKDLAETVMDIEKEIDELRTFIKTIKNEEKIGYNKVEDINTNNRFESNYPNSKEDVISEIRFSKVKEDNNNIKYESKLDKTQRVKTLLEDGLSEEEICEELSIGRGEVLLIKSLLKK